MATLKRTLIQLDEDTYDKLRHCAFEKGRSISAVAREILSDALRPKSRKKRTKVQHFSFVGAGRSRQGRLAPVSERHDEALSELKE